MIGIGETWRRCSCLAVLISLFLSVFVSLPSLASAGSDNAAIIQLLEPESDTLVIGKRPAFIFRIKETFSPDDLLVLFDGADVTGIAEISEGGFSFVPVQAAAPGAHVITVILDRPESGAIERQFEFITRHTGAFEEITSRNDITGAYEKKGHDSPDTGGRTNYTFEGNIASDSVIREDPWQLNLRSNLRYLDQNLAVYPPVEKGINLADYLLTGTYAGNEFQLRTELGDVRVDETPNTVSLSRRGGSFAFDHALFRINTFAVKSEEVFGFKGGTGLGGSSDDHIMGVSGEAGLFSGKVRLKTVYATGGEKAPGYSVYDPTGDSKGDVLGFVIAADLLENSLQAEAEIDFSSYDADTEDEFSESSGKAYRAGVNGYSGAYRYGANYEYADPDYQVIGNPFLQNDREGFSVNAGANYPLHSVNMMFSQFNDNVKNDALYPRIYTYQGQANYMYNGFEAFPLGVSMQKSILESTDEPEFSFPLKEDTDSVSGMVSYASGPLNLGLQAGFSHQDDRTEQNNDSDAINYSLSSSYRFQNLCVTPSASFNRAKYRQTGIRSDTTTATLDLRGRLWEERFNYEGAGTYTRTETNDHSVKQDGYNARFRLAYRIAQDLWGLSEPSAGIMGNYSMTYDYVNNLKNRELIILIVFSTSVPVIF